MTDLYRDIAAFHEKFKLAPVSGSPGSLAPEVVAFRIGFMKEELAEFEKAVVSGDAEGQLDALVDLVYVALGTAYLSRFPFVTAWERVHYANMQKVRAEKAEDSKRGASFDVVKPLGWKAPTHDDLVEDTPLQIRKFFADLDLPNDEF